jgi:hypothetical protein
MSSLNFLMSKHIHSSQQTTNNRNVVVVVNDDENKTQPSKVEKKSKSRSFYEKPTRSEDFFLILGKTRRASTPHTFIAM